MKKHIIIFLIIFLPISLSAIGISDWKEKTPKGNEINNINGVSLYLKNEKQLDGLWKWYFYKGYIIGQTADTSVADMDISYFVVNETTYQITKFNSIEDWEAYLKKSELKPKVWTRWYFGDWTFFNDDIFFVGFYLFIPLAILFMFLFYKAIKKEKLRLFKPYTTIIVLLFSLIFCYWLLDQFPNSI